MRTLDQLAYDFQAVGEFVLTRSLIDDLEVQGRMEQLAPRFTSFTVLTAVAMEVAGDAVVIEEGLSPPHEPRLRVNGTARMLPESGGDPISLPGGGTIRRTGKTLLVQWPDARARVDVWQTGNRTLSTEVRPANLYSDNVVGLLGTMDGNPQTDFTTRDETVLERPITFEELYQDFGESWRIQQEESLFGTPTFADRSIPETQTTTNDLSSAVAEAAEETCRNRGITDPVLLDNCIYDVGMSGNSTFAENATRLVGQNPRSQVKELPIASSTRFLEDEGTKNFDPTGVNLRVTDVIGSGDITVSRYDEGPSGTDGISESNVSAYRLTIEADSSLSISSAQLQLTVSAFGGISDPSGVTIYTRDTPGSGAFAPLETTVGTNDTPDDISDDTLYATTSSLGELVLASDDAANPLPVELTRFDATQDEETVTLTWTTASETRNAAFQIQRRPVEPSRPAGGMTSGSRNGPTPWQTIGSVDGAGTTTEAQSYRFTDADLPYEADALTYRLKQIDTDGTEHFTGEVTVERGVTEVELLGTYPNPARQRATVRYALPDKQEATIRLYDVLGRRVQTVLNKKQEGRHQRTLDVGALPSGVYFLRLRAGGQTRTQKFTVTR
jgi:hypothetical protein